jgi:hypothetical protein
MQLYTDKDKKAGGGAAVSKDAPACGWSAALVVENCETGASLPYV